jgi:hypothetical protein
MTTRASIILWSAGSGILLGVFIDVAIIGIWLVVATVFPAIAPRPLPRWILTVAVTVLAAIPVAAGVLGYLEGRLKLD